MEIKRNKAWRRFQENRVFKARMLKFAGWQIVVWDENGNCIEHPHWFEIAKQKWAKKYKDCSTPCSCAICRAEKYSRLQFKKETDRTYSIRIVRVSVSLMLSHFVITWG